MGRRSSGSAWIEPKHGVPCRVCWRRNGERQKPSRWFKLRKHAIKLRDAINTKAAAERHIIVAGQWLPLSEVLHRWTAARIAAGSMGEGTAFEARREISAILAQTEWETVADITPQALQDWRRRYPKKARGVPMRYLRAMLRWSALGHTLAQSVAQGLDLSTPQTTPAHRPLATDAQIAEALSIVRADGQAPLIHVASIYPWRPKSLSLLQIKDLDLADRENASCLLRRTKNGRDVRGPLMPETVDVLAPVVRNRPPEAFVFLRPDGTPWPLDKKGSAHAMSRWFRVTLGQAGLRLYDLKRKGMTDLARAADGDIATVAEIAGISKAMVLRYLQTNNERVRAAMKKRATFGGR